MDEARDRRIKWIWVIIAIALLITIVIALQQMQLGTSKKSEQIGRQLKLVQTARYALATISEAQNGAVMARAESDRQYFVSQAKDASTELSDAMTKLSTALSEQRRPQIDRMRQSADQAFAHFEQLHKDLIELATQNSNYRAYELAYGSMTVALNTIDESLTQIIANHAKLSSVEDRHSSLSSNEARVGALRIFSLLMPHIAERDESKMNQLETSIEREERRVTENLDALTSLGMAGDSLSLEKAEAAWKDFRNLRSEIIPLSRMNTNLRSAGLALNERRAAMLAIQDSLAAMEAALESERQTSIVPQGR